MSPVATQEKTAAGDQPVDKRVWTRTPEQEELVREHLELIARQYAGADPALRALLEKPDILGTAELVDLLGYSTASKTKGTRLFQLGMKTRELVEGDQVPHPGALPEHDATAGHRGAYEIRGVMYGRAAHWAVHSGRLRWDAPTRTLVLQTEINHGGAPKQR